MKVEMTAGTTIVGSMLVFLAVVCVVVFFPTLERPTEPSPYFRPRTPLENAGRQVFLANGCMYCHSQYVRPQDWDYGNNRVAHPGDYIEDSPPLLGSERQGPDLSQEGGLRSDDWHRAHFHNPRFTRPESIMPPFDWMGDDQITTLTAFIQSLSGKEADPRMERQRYWKVESSQAYDSGPDSNMKWLHDHVPPNWMTMSNPYPADEVTLKRGEAIFLSFCIGCHGPVGDGKGPADPFIKPPPFNFTYLRKWTGAIGGMIYYQVMNGITGTAMPSFKTELESARIWDVSNYVAVYFAGGADTFRGPLGIPASYEPPRPGEAALAPQEKK